MQYIVVKILYEMVPEKIFEFRFEKMKWLIQVKYGHGIQRVGNQLMKVGMSGSVIQMTGNNQLVVGTRSTVGRTEINIILNIELSIQLV